MKINIKPSGLFALILFILVQIFTWSTGQASERKDKRDIPQIERRLPETESKVRPRTLDSGPKREDGQRRVRREIPPATVAPQTSDDFLTSFTNSVGGFFRELVEDTPPPSKKGPVAKGGAVQRSGGGAPKRSQVKEDRNISLPKRAKTSSLPEAVPVVRSEVPKPSGVEVDLHIETTLLPKKLSPKVKAKKSGLSSSQELPSKSFEEKKLRKKKEVKTSIDFSPGVKVGRVALEPSNQETPESVLPQIPFSEVEGSAAIVIQSSPLPALDLSLGPIGEDLVIEPSNQETQEFVSSQTSLSEVEVNAASAIQSSPLKTLDFSLNPIVITEDPVVEPSSRGDSDTSPSLIPIPERAGQDAVDVALKSGPPVIAVTTDKGVVLDTADEYAHVLSILRASSDVPMVDDFPLSLPILKSQGLLSLTLGEPLGEGKIPSYPSPANLTNKFHPDILWKKKNPDWEVKGKKYHELRDDKSSLGKLTRLPSYYTQSPSLGDSTVILTSQADLLAYLYELDRQIQALNALNNHINTLIDIYSMGQKMYQEYLTRCGKNTDTGWVPYLASFIFYNSWSEWFAAEFSPEKVREIVEKKYPPFAHSSPLQIKSLLNRFRISRKLSKRVFEVPQPTERTKKIRKMLLDACTDSAIYPNISASPSFTSYDVLPVSVNSCEIPQQPELRNYTSVVLRDEKFAAAVRKREPFMVNDNASLKQDNGFLSWNKHIDAVNAELIKWHQNHGTYAFQQVRGDAGWEDYTACVGEDRVALCAAVDQDKRSPSFRRLDIKLAEQDARGKLAKFNQLYEQFRVSKVAFNKLVAEVLTLKIGTYFLFERGPSQTPSFKDLVSIKVGAQLIKDEDLCEHPLAQDFLRTKGRSLFPPKVSEIDLSENYLRGHFAPLVQPGTIIPSKYLYNIGFVPEVVTVLVLDFNQIEDLRFLRRLVNLRELSVASNRLCHVYIPWELTALETLNLQSNQIESLEFSSALMSGDMIHHGHTKLATLRLRWNFLKGSLQCFEPLRSLTSLDLRNNSYLQTELPPEIERLQALLPGLKIISPQEDKSDLTQ